MYKESTLLKTSKVSSTYSKLEWIVCKMRFGHFLTNSSYKAIRYIDEKMTIIVCCQEKWIRFTFQRLLKSNKSSANQM